MRRWKEKNRERYLEHKRRHYRANPQPYKARAAKWLRDNPDRRREYDRWRRARLQDQFVAEVTMDNLTAETGNLCGLCGNPIEEPPHVDHIVPLAVGGTHEPANCQLAHPLCNWRKGVKTDFRFYGLARTGLAPA